MGHRAPEPRRRAGQAAHRQGREPRHGAHRRAPGMAGPRRHTRRRPRSTPTTSACSNTAADREHAEAVHLGIASHNLFDIAYGLDAARGPRRPAWIEFEMLEGMANHQARAVRARAGGLLLYAPVVRTEDFHSAIAYLVRRLDENTAPENFLRHVFDLEPGSPDGTRSATDSWPRSASRATLSDAPRRTQDRSTEDARAGGRTGLSAPSFENDPDTDWTLRRTARGSRASRTAGAGRAPEVIPLQVGGEFHTGAGEAEGHDPSRPGGVAYRYALGGPAGRRPRARPSPAPRSRRGAGWPRRSAGSARGVRGRARTGAAATSSAR